VESLCVSFLVCGKEGRLWIRRYRSLAGQVVQNGVSFAQAYAAVITRRGAASMRVQALKYQYKTKHAQEEFDINLQVKT